MLDMQKILQHKVFYPDESYYTYKLVESPRWDYQPCLEYRKLKEVTEIQYFPSTIFEQKVEYAY